MMNKKRSYPAIYQIEAHGFQRVSFASGFCWAADVTINGIRYKLIRPGAAGIWAFNGRDVRFSVEDLDHLDAMLSEALAAQEGI